MLVVGAGSERTTQEPSPGLSGMRLAFSAVLRAETLGVKDPPPMITRTGRYAQTMAHLAALTVIHSRQGARAPGFRCPAECSLSVTVAVHVGCPGGPDPDRHHVHEAVAAEQKIKVLAVFKSVAPSAHSG